MTTIGYPETCHCVFNAETHILIEKCRSHDTFAEMKAHNQRTAEKDYDTEKRKPEFQRR